MAALAEPQMGQEFRQEWNPLSHDNTVRLYEFAGRPARGQVLLRDCESQAEQRFSVSPFIYFTDGDHVRIEYGAKGAIVRMDKLLHVAGRNGSEDEAAIFPYYARSESLSLVTGKQIPVMFKEVTTEDEFLQLRFLEQFHYLQAKPAWGRQMYLIVAPAVDEVLGTPLPGVLGCVVLTSPSLLSGPRNNLLDWNDRSVLKENVDRVVRIARVIVHPEFRGLRIGAKLVQHAVAYCRERWNVKGKKAWFVETVAEMSRYHPFFEQGGLRFIGETKAEDSAVFFDDDPKRLGIDQGEGQVMASIRRFKQKVRTRKPYLMASLLPAEDPLSVKIASASPEPLAAGPTGLVLDPLPHPMVFHHVTAAYAGRTVWEEPEELNSKWLEASNKSRADLGAYMSKLSSLVRGLLDNDLWKADDVAAKELLPTLRRIDTKVQDGCSNLETMAIEGERLLTDLSSSLDAILRNRHELLHSLASSRSGIEHSIKHINETAEAFRERDEHLPPEMSRRRAALNELRSHLQSVESQLELGAVSSPQRWVTDAFGVRPGQVTVTLRDFNLEIWPGSIVLVVGPSGSGKSTLLSLLSGNLKPAEGQITPPDLPQHVSVLDLNFDPSRPLIDLVGKDEREAVYLLNHVDLAEAHLYIKRRDQLSHGQRYRAAFARMLAHRQPVWVADEFCAFLDPVTTLTLCKGIRKLIQRQKITFVAAAAKEDYIREALQPDIVIRINAGGQITPAPKPQHWTIAPTREHVLQAIQGNPDTVPLALGRWLRQLSLIENDPVALSGVRWTGAAQRLREVASSKPEQFSKALADHLWARDWLFHRVWNRLVHPEAFSSGDGCASDEKPSQLRYRQVLAMSLHTDGLV